MAEKIKISAKELAEHIKAGMPNSTLKKRFGLSDDQLLKAKRRLVEMGMITDADLLWTCSKCGYRNESGVRQCPRCGVVRGYVPKEKVMPTAPKLPWYHTTKTRLVIILAFGFMSFIYVMASLPPLKPTSQNRAKGPDKYEIIYAAETYVKQHLKIPKSAEFNSRRVAVHDLGDGIFTVFGDVESKNAFGVMIPMQFQCIMTHHGGDSWSLKGLELVDRATGRQYQK